MANGDVISLDGHAIRYKMLDASNAVLEGDWLSLANYPHSIVSVEGGNLPAGDTIELYISTSDKLPSSPATGTPEISITSTAQSVFLPNGATYVKQKRTVSTAAITLNLNAYTDRG